MTAHLCNFIFKRLPRSNQNRGATLLEVVIVIAVIGIFITAAYQFLLLANARTRAQMADQMLNDKLNLFFTTLAKDFRTAKEMEYEKQDGIIRTMTLKTTDGKTIRYEVRNEEKRILRNGTEIVKGAIAIISLGGEQGKPELLVAIPNTAGGSSARNYTISVARRNKLKVTEKK